MSIQTEQERQGACQKGFKTMCGGQALIEGIMMRGPKSSLWWSAGRTESWRYRRKILS